MKKTILMILTFLFTQNLFSQESHKYKDNVKKGLELLYRKTDGQCSNTSCISDTQLNELIQRSLDFKNVFDSIISSYQLTGFQKKQINQNLSEFQFASPIQREGSSSNTVYGYIYEPSLPPGCEKLQFPATLFIHHVADKIDDEKTFSKLAAEWNKGVVMLIYLPEYGPRKKVKSALPFASDIHEFKLQLLQSLTDIHVAGEILKSHPLAKRGSLQLGGLSLGAMVTAISAGIDPMFDNYLIALGGGDLAGIMTSDKTRHGGEIKNALSNISWTPEEARFNLSSLDALTWAFNVKNKKITILNALNDELVEHSSFIKLVEAYKSNSNEVTTRVYESTHVPNHRELGIGKALKIYTGILYNIFSFLGQNKSGEIQQCNVYNKNN